MLRLFIASSIIAAGFAAALAAVARGLGNLGQHASLPAVTIDDAMKSLSIFGAPA